MVAFLLRVKGLVQGVYYRESLRREAATLGVCGWVRNRSDKSVEAFLQGDPIKVRQLMEWCRKGPPSARVDGVEEESAKLDPTLNSFTRRDTI